MKLETKYVDKIIARRELDKIKAEIRDAHMMLEKGSGPGSDFTGWLHLPSSTKKDLSADVQKAGAFIRDISDAFIVIGIGGSYLGARAAIEFLAPPHNTDRPQIYFAGNNIDPGYLHNLLTSVKDRHISVNVISKSGTTTEPAIAFRVIKNFMKKKYSKTELRNRIVCTTTKGKGALWTIARQERYRTFHIPEDIGGRFSVLTPAGLLPMAVAGIDIQELIRGARAIESQCASYDIGKNLAYRYAALRNLLHRNGKKIEVICSFHHRLLYFMEWWKQLFAESEGKDGKGLFAAAALFSTDLHSIGQLIQDGERNLFETFLNIQRPHKKIKIPYERNNLDCLNYLSGKTMGYVNKMAYRGTRVAHAEGNAPNMTLSIDDASPYSLGELFYFFQRAIAVSGYLLRVNPFNQPGVEAYKTKMLELLGKPK